MKIGYLFVDKWYFGDSEPASTHQITMSIEILNWQYCIWRNDIFWIWMKAEARKGEAGISEKLISILD